MKMPGKCTGPKFLGRRHLGGHDLGSRMDRQGGVLIWCRKCSGFARQRMGPKLMNCGKPEQMGTKECGKMLKRIQVLEDGGGVLAKEARSSRIEGQKRGVTRKEYQRLLNKFEMEGFMSKKDCGISSEKRCRGTEEQEGDAIREYTRLYPRCRQIVFELSFCWPE